MSLKFWKKDSKKDKNGQVKIRTRIAPSPTGPLHIGTARAALFNYLFAKHNQGDFILRMEDTDVERSDPRFEKNIIDGLKWLGINWTEGPYRQSERLEIYQKYIEQLLKEGSAFKCSHTLGNLAEEKKEQMDKKEAPRHICQDKNKNLKKGIIRLKTPSKIVEFRDLIRRDIKFDTSLLGDIAIAKDERTPLYNLAVVIDDYLMKISHVIRGEDHISNTPKQILIQEALGLPRPQYGHLPLVLGPDRSKLSKRHNVVSVEEYRQDGYLAEALINFMVLLGWNPGTEQEIFSLEELVKKFDLRRIQKGGAIFNIERLNWLNGIYIRKKSPEDLSNLIINEGFLKTSEVLSFEKKYIEKVVVLEQPRMQKLSEIGERADYFFTEPKFSKSSLFWQGEETPEETKQHLDKILEIISHIKMGDWGREKIKAAVWPYAEENGRGNVLWPMRFALTGQVKSPDPFEIAEILGKEKTINRLEAASKLLNK